MEGGARPKPNSADAWPDGVLFFSALLRGLIAAHVGQRNTTFTATRSMATITPIMTPLAILQAIAAAGGRPLMVTRETPLAAALDDVTRLVQQLALERVECQDSIEEAAAELASLRVLRDEAATLPCDWTPLTAAVQFGHLDYEPPAPAVGAEMCDAECHACRLRVRALATLA